MQRFLALGQNTEAESQHKRFFFIDEFLHRMATRDRVLLVGDTRQHQGVEAGRPYIIASLVLNKGKMLGVEELEINLSPTAQKTVFEKLKQHIYTDSDLVTQVIITSHSDYFQGRQDVRCYGVEHNGQHTTDDITRSASRRPE